MAETLQMMYELADELPVLSQRARRAGYKLDEEWTRSVWSLSQLSLAYLWGN